MLETPKSRLTSKWRPRTYADVLDFLQNDLSRPRRHLFSGAPGLEQTKTLLTTLGNPQNAVQAVHIAGTAGKGSVAYALADGLCVAGLKTGLHVSPHVYDLRERLQVNGVLATRSQTVRLLRVVLQAVRDSYHTSDLEPTFFDTIAAMAFLHFAYEGCEIAVIEVGIGGTFDTTNTIERADKIAVITRIGFDHENVLGDTLVDISRQKAGILPYGGRAVALHHAIPEIDETILSEAQGRKCRLSLVRPSYRASTPRHLVENEAMVQACRRLLHERQLLPLTPIRSSIPHRVIPGRFELSLAGNQLVVLDGAHNAMKLAALLDRLDAELPGSAAVWLFGCRRDKKAADMLRQLSGRQEPVCLAEYPIYDYGVPAEMSMSTLELQELGSAYGLQATAVNSLVEGWRFLRDHSPAVGVITGSFSLLAAIRPVIAGSQRI